VGQRDIVFIRGNGEIGCPLVDGALGRIQLVAGGQATDPGSPSSTDPALPAVIARAIDAAALAPVAQARAVDPAVPFSFSRPRRATPEQMTRAAARMRARATPAAAPLFQR
jgi:hypothetical protein